MIDVKSLTKYYGPVAAIEDVTFRVGSGEIIGFLGPNAAGKTTTMRILTGFSPATFGTAVVAGFDVHQDPVEVKRRVGYLPENVSLYGEMLVSSFLFYVAEVKGVPRSQRPHEVARVMAHCGLSSMATRLLGNLSKGYRQRTGIAQALIGDPPVLILDEPTVGLDPSQIIEIRQMIKNLGRDHTVLISTHILPEVTMVCDRVIIIHEGRIVEEDSLANLAGGGRTILEVDVEGPERAVMEALRRIDEITSFYKEAPGRYRVEGRAGAELGEPVARVLVGAGLGLRGLGKRSRTLEDVFMSVIAQEADGSHPQTPDGGAR